jgi:phage antirepressor YoqD-like protein
MNELVKVETNSSGMMSSKRIAEKTKKTHSHVLRDIKHMIVELQLNPIWDNPIMDDVDYKVIKDERGYDSEILLNEKLSMCLASGYSISLRMMIIEDWAEMKKPKELSRLEILTLALESEKKVIELQEKIEVDKPKVEFAEQLLSATNSLDFGTSCKAMNLPFGRNKMFEICRKLNFIMHNNQPYQTYIDQGYFTLLETSYINTKSGDRVLTTKTMITAKGQNWLIKNFKKNGLM